MSWVWMLIAMLRRPRARGGYLPSRPVGEQVLLTRGVAVIPDQMDIRVAREIAGPDVDVYTISEWIGRCGDPDCDDEHGE